MFRALSQVKIKYPCKNLQITVYCLDFLLIIFFARRRGLMLVVNRNCVSNLEPKTLKTTVTSPQKDKEQNESRKIGLFEKTKSMMHLYRKIVIKILL